jgi:hypothetical protein
MRLTKFLEANIVDVNASTEDGTVIERACANFALYASAETWLSSSDRGQNAIRRWLCYLFAELSCRFTESERTSPTANTLLRLMTPSIG